MGLITELAGVRDDFDGEDSSDSSPRDFLNFCEDFRGGGLGGIGDKRFFFFFLSPFSPLTVEFDDDDVRDSRSDGRPCTSRTPVSPSLGLGTLPARLLDTGGRLVIGLAWRRRGVIRRGATMLGDCDDIEVGVVSLLYAPGPGDSEKRVEGLAL